jgi:HlyD family secretion protein
MKRKGFIFIVAAIGIASSLFAIKRGTMSPPKTPLLVEPAQKPYQKTVAAAGLIEALGENISIGSPQDGVVEKVYVLAQSTVKKGDPLFQLDTRELVAELKVAEAKEEVARAQLAQIQDQLARIRSIKDTRATSLEEIRSKENESAIAAATLTQMQQEKAKIVSLIDRLTIRSPINGIVLQKNIQVGEYLVASNVNNPPFVIGNTSTLQVRTDIDEYNASHLDPQAPAIAYLKNKPDYPISLSFLRIEPLVVPKVSLTGLSKEKVDTRVLQVIYTFQPPKDLFLYVGQQVDVYIQRGTAE